MNRYLIIFLCILASCATKHNSKEIETHTKAISEVERSEYIANLRNLAAQNKVNEFENQFNDLCKHQEFICQKAIVLPNKAYDTFKLKKNSDSLFRLDGKDGNALLFFVGDK